MNTIPTSEKWVAMMGYLFFALPLFLGDDKHKHFSRHHAKQGLILQLFLIIVNLFSSLIPILGVVIIAPLGSLFGAVLFVIGLYNAWTGTTLELPGIGHYAKEIRWF
jgi:uncharacterized membrane protein